MAIKLDAFPAATATMHHVSHTLTVTKNVALLDNFGHYLYKTTQQTYTPKISKHLV
jgi:hypothetical protein